MTHGFWKRSRRPGARRLIATALRRLADGVERPWPRLAAARGMVSASPTLMSPEYIRFQRMPHRVLARYVAIAGTQVLEIGGAQACISARAFLDDGAAGVTVTGLDHVAEESESADRRLRIMKADALDLRRHFEADCFDLVFGLSVIEHIPHPDRLLVEVDRVLKPGGLALFEGYPLWWSPLGHHLWVAAWGGAIRRKDERELPVHRRATRASDQPRAGLGPSPHGAGGTRALPCVAIAAAPGHRLHSRLDLRGR